MKKFIFLLCFFFVTPVHSAEFAIYIGADPSGSFEDGDILHAMNDLRILDVHAQHIVHPKLAARNKDTLISTDSLTAFYLERTKQYKMERISTDGVRRTNLLTGATDFINNTANGNGERMDVPVYIERRLRSPRHQIFGVKGAEVWYGGRSSCTLPEVNNVWTEIEAKTSFNKADHREWPFTPREKNKYLLFKVNDFDNTERGELESSLPGTTRKHNVDWRNDLGLTAEQKTTIETKSGSLDFRSLSAKDRNNIVGTKTK